MKLEILMSCMHQEDDSLVGRSNLKGDVLMINQCDREDVREYPTQRGIAKMYSVKCRGLTKSRNLAIERSQADIGMLCDDDEYFVDDYEERILSAYKDLPDADIIAFKMIDRRNSLGDKTTEIKFPKTMRVSSCQISFRLKSLKDSGVRFDELLGAGTENGAEEELKFLTDCERAGLKIYFVPIEIARVAEDKSTWFKGFTEQFFVNRGATTRYILGLPMASIYAVYYIIKKRNEYGGQISPFKACKAIFRGMIENKVTKQKQKGC